jgi:Fibronectin type III domain
MKRRLVCCLICLIYTVLPAAAVLASGSGTNITATVPLVISNVSVSGITSSSAVIAWQTNGASNSRVEYGADSSYGLIASQPADATSSHSVTLNNLNPSSTYHFRAESTVSGLTGVSTDNSFVTLAAAGGGETTTTTSTTTTSTTTTTTTISTTPTTTASTTATTTTGTSTTHTTTTSTATSTTPTTTTTSAGTTQTTWTPTATGATPATIALATADNKDSVTIPKGTLALDKNGAPLEAITCGPPSAPPPPPPTADTLVADLELGPTGATFNPAITVNMQYDPSTLPAGAGEGDLIIAFYDTTTGTWVPLSNIVIDTVHNTISCTTTHFTQFAVIYAPTGITGTTTTTAAGPTVSFVKFSVTPQYDSTTSKLASAEVSYLVRNIGPPLSQVDLVLKVVLDNSPLEDVPLQSLAQLPAGDTSGNMNYIPAQGWKSGTYTFRIEMAAGGQLYTTSPEQQVTVPLVGSVRLVLISEIFGAAILVIAGVISLILIRRRRALKEAGRR